MCMCFRKVIVHLGYGSDLYRRSWTSLPKSFISAQRISERRSAERVLVASVFAGNMFLRYNLRQR
jgi:hypothetical protein